MMKMVTATVSRAGSSTSCPGHRANKARQPVINIVDAGHIVQPAKDTKQSGGTRGIAVRQAGGDNRCRRIGLCRQFGRQAVCRHRRAIAIEGHCHQRSRQPCHKNAERQHAREQAKFERRACHIDYIDLLMTKSDGSAVMAERRNGGVMENLRSAL